MKSDIPIFLFLFIIVIALLGIAYVVGFVKENKKQIGNFFLWLIIIFMGVCFFGGMLSTCGKH